MIESPQDLQKFELENLQGDLIVHVVPLDEDTHSADMQASVLFLRNLSTSTTYYYAFNHPDSSPEVTPKQFFEVISSLENRKWALDKKLLEQLCPLKNVVDANLAGYMMDNSIVELADYDTSAHFLIRRYANGHKRLNMAIPILKHKEVFDELADDLESKIISKFEVDTAFLRFNQLIIETLGDIERQGIFVDREKFKARYKTEPNTDGIVYSQYNVYTSTGRPSNRFGGINFAALGHNDGSRACIRSRYGNDGKIVVVDYTAFHPRIICTLTKYPIPVDRNIYEYLATLYYQRKDVDETDIENAKLLTFRQLYGGVEAKYAHIKYLANLKTFIDEQWEFFNQNGYVLTPIFKRKITKHHIEDPNPSKIFNYILQAVEGEIAIPQIKLVQKYLLNKKTKGILYTYDAMLYDFHREDGLETLNGIREIMSANGAFPMKTYIGDSYQTVRLIDV